MDFAKRRDFLKKAILGGGTAVLGAGLVWAQDYSLNPADENLWKGINRLKDPQNETGLEKLHIPVIDAPRNVAAGVVFDAGIVIGKTVHPMSPTHWIEYVQLGIGNEPAGMVTFRSHGFVKPISKFGVVLDQSLKGISKNCD